VAIVGAGGLGSPAVLALAAAGVGALTVIDDDVVDASNLQRQIMHRWQDIGAPKTASATRVAREVSETRMRAVTERLAAENALSLLAGADVVLDGSDAFATRGDVAAACETLGVPLVWGSVQETAGQVTVFWSQPPSGEAIVLADLYPAGSVAPACADVGVLGTLCLQLGSLMATEAIKLICGIGEPLLGRVLVIDALGAHQREVPLRPRSALGEADPIRQVSPDDVLIDKWTVLDVREADEVAGGMLPGAIHLPLADVLADPAALTDGPYLVVCQSGARALRAAEALRASAIPAAVLAGGMAQAVRLHPAE
ncbi:MAG: ThiF family adenylyltransferase, partial [Microbacterium sp.]